MPMQAAPQRSRVYTGSTQSDSLVSLPAPLVVAANAASRIQWFGGCQYPKINRTPKPEIRVLRAISRLSSASEKAMDVYSKTLVSLTPKEQRLLGTAKGEK